MVHTALWATALPTNRRVDVKDFIFFDGEDDDAKNRKVNASSIISMKVSNVIRVHLHPHLEYSPCAQLVCTTQRHCYHPYPNLGFGITRNSTFRGRCAAIEKPSVDSRERYRAYPI